MKLRTKITVAMMTILAMTIAVSMSVMIYKAYSLNEEDSYSSVYIETKSLFDKYIDSETKNVNTLSEEMQFAASRYTFMKLATVKYSGSEYVLQAKDGDIYNNSGIDPRATLDTYGEKFPTEMKSGDYRKVIIKWQGKYYCIVGTSLGDDEDIKYISVVRDITESTNQIKLLGYFCVGISSLLLLLAAAGVFVFLKWQFVPLKNLELQANEIAKKYSDGLSVENESAHQDEIQALSKSFNQMNSITEEYIEKVEANAKEQKLLLTALAHEMRTPVTAITGYAYALKNAALSEEQKAEAITFIDSESRRLERLSTKLTELIALSKKEIEPCEIDMDSWALQLRSILNTKVEQDEISYKLRIKKETCTNIKGDADLLTEMIINFFDNACKAGATEIEVAIEDDSIQVIDNGPGISEEEIQKITQPFYQGDSSRKQEGFGIGLALCQMIAQAHGAQLKIESALGEGSKFIVHFTNPLHFNDDSKIPDTI